MFSFFKKFWKPEPTEVHPAQTWMDGLEQGMGAQEKVFAYPHPNNEPNELLYCARFNQGKYTLWSTFGFADANSLENHNQPQELCLVINSTNEAWGKALIDLADSQYGKNLMVPGATFKVEGFISSTESRMKGFLVEEQAIVIFPDDLVLPLKLKTAWLVIPLYEGEVALLQRTGRKQVLNHPDFQAFSHTRPDLSAKFSA